jgi:hypothetical protein
LHWEARLYQRPNSIDLTLIEGMRALAEADHAGNSWQVEYGQSIFWIETTKHVSGKQRNIYVFKAIGPPTPDTAGGHKFCKSSAF